MKEVCGKMMTNILQVLTGTEAYDEIRTINPLWHIQDELWAANIIVHFVQVSRLSSSLAALQEFDHVIFHGAPSVNMINLLKQMPCSWSMAVDDWQVSVPAWNPTRLSATKIKVLRWCWDHCSKIICTTRHLALAIGGLDPYYPAKCVVVPNLMELKSYEPRGDTIAYIGGNSHARDIDLLSGLTHKTVIFSNTLPKGLCETYRNEFGEPRLRPGVDHIGWLPCQANYEYYTTYRDNLGVKVGLAPLVDCPFNACKSVLKVIEYTSLSAVSVVSNVLPYSELPSDVVVKVEGDWNGAVDYALGHPEIGRRCFDYCMDNFSYNKNKDYWVNLYASICNS